MPVITCSQRTAKASQSQKMANSYMRVLPLPIAPSVAEIRLPRQMPQITEQFQHLPENASAAAAMSYVDNLRTFVRVYELGSMSAAGRDQRVSAAVASARIAELERHLGVRLFNRTTRSLQPTEQGAIFYKGALKILEPSTRPRPPSPTSRRTRAARCTSPHRSGSASG